MKCTIGIVVIKQMRESNFKENKFQGSNFAKTRL